MQDQEAIKNFFKQPTVKSALVLLTLRYHLSVTELLQLILSDTLDWMEVADFLQTEYGVAPVEAQELQEKMRENFQANFLLFLEDQDEFLNNYTNEAVASDEQIEKMIVAEERKLNKEKWLNFIQSSEFSKNIADLERAAGQNWPAIYDYLWSNLGLNKTPEVIIILYYLASKDKLSALWQDDHRFHGILQKQLSFSYSAGVVRKLMQEKINCPILAQALRMVLVDKLELNKHEGAMLALSITNSLPISIKRQYVPMVYWDETAGEWQWTQFIINQDGGVTIQT